MSHQAHDRCPSHPLLVFLIVLLLTIWISLWIGVLLTVGSFVLHEQCFLLLLSQSIQIVEQTTGLIIEFLYTCVSTFWLQLGIRDSSVVVTSRLLLLSSSVIECLLAISSAFGSCRQVEVQVGVELGFLKGLLSWKVGLCHVQETLHGKGWFPHWCEL